MAGVYWREAATLILISKKSPQIAKQLHIPNYEALFLKRSGKSHFMPKMHVFPGGTVDSSDFDGKWVKYLATKGVLANDMMKKFQCKSKRLELYENKANIAELGFRICALRETFEETGLLLVKDRKNNGTNVISDKSLAEAWMPKIQNDPSQFLTLFEHIGETPPIMDLHEWSCWLTPTVFGGMKKRFDTVFYMIFTDSEFSLLDRSSDYNESDYLEITCPLKMLTQCVQKKIKLAPPQIYELSKMLQMTDFFKFKEFCNRRAALGTNRWLPIVYQAKNGFISVLPGDSLYPDEGNIFGADSEVLSIDKTLEEALLMGNLNRLQWTAGNVCTLPVVNIELEHGQLRPIDRDSLQIDLPASTC